MINQDHYGFADEFYIIEKTVEIVVQIAGEAKTIRIEALHRPASGNYHTRAYIQEYIRIQPTYPQTKGKFDRSPEDKQLWVDYDLPWTDRETADDAIIQALGFLRLHCD